MNFGSNSPLESNRKIFVARFPELASLLCLETPESTQSIFSSIPKEYRIEKTASGLPTLSVRGTYLHSRYNPLRDAERAVSQADSFTATGCFFAGSGLGYIPEEYAKKFPESPLVLVEPDIYVFFSCLSARPLEGLLNHPNLILAIGIPAGEVTSLLEQTNLLDIPSYEFPALMAPSRSWWDEFAILRARNKKKKNINANTLRKFGKLWLRNMCKNLNEMQKCPGIESFTNLGKGFPALVLAAGPSLDRIVPYLPALSKRMVIIAVDTAARACVTAGIEPDFIVVVDPQYWNWRHLGGLSCPNTFLITESAAWPAVFRFPCRGVFLCASLFPLGKFLEKHTGTHAELGAGGSVSTSAWDFARHLGVTQIYLAGLDLGYPEKKTHFSGGLFEEWAHDDSSRQTPTETSLYRRLSNAPLHQARDYHGNPVLTDTRLQLYVWWFESRIAQFSLPPTITLTPEGVMIPGVSIAEEKTLLEFPIIRSFIKERFSKVSVEQDDSRKEIFAHAIADLMKTLDDILHLAEDGLAAGERHTFGKTALEREHALAMLNRIDKKILNHPAKEIVAMVFSFAEESQSEDSPKDPLKATKNLYTALVTAVKLNISTLIKFN